MHESGREGRGIPAPSLIAMTNWERADGLSAHLDLIDSHGGRPAFRTGMREDLQLAHAAGSTLSIAFR